MYMPNPRDVIQAIDAVTGDLLWQHNRNRPDDLADYMIGTIIDVNRNIAIHGKLIIDTSMDDYIFALHAETGEMVWETEVLDYKVNPANQTSGPIIANGKVISGRSCDPRGGPHACVVTAHDPRDRRGAVADAADPRPPASRGTKRGATCRSRSAVMSARGWRRASIRRSTWSTSALR